MERVTGLILAGGRATRMGAVDKGLQALDERPLVAHALERLAPQVAAIVVSANRHRADYAAFGHPVVADPGHVDIGPLAGIQAGLAVCTTELMVVVPCDAPWFPVDLVARLSAPLDDATIDIASVVTATRAHPIFCLVRRSVAPALAAYLAGGRRSVHGWLEASASRAVSFADEDAFRNLNTLEDLHAAHARRG